MLGFSIMEIASFLAGVGSYLGFVELGCGSWPQSSLHDMICGDGHAHYRAHVHGPSSHVIFSLHCVAPEATKNRIGYQGGNSSFGQGLGLAVNTRSDGVQGNVSNHRSRFHEDFRHYLFDRRSFQTHCQRISSCRK